MLVIPHHHLRLVLLLILPVGPFPDSSEIANTYRDTNACYYGCLLTKIGLMHALNAGSDFVLQQVAHV